MSILKKYLVDIKGKTVLLAEPDTILKLSWSIGFYVRLSFILILYLILQSCTTYYTTAVPIQQAVNGKSVKIIDKNGKVKKYKYLELHNDSLYYGCRPFDDEMKQIPGPYDTYSVYKMNKEESADESFFGLLYILVGLVFIPLFIVKWWPD